MIKLYHGDFLEKAKNIPDDSVDLVLTDPPYGTVKGMKLGNKKGHETYSWDGAIEPKVLFGEINRILRKNGKAVLFGQEPFTSRMITEAIPNLPFSYRMIWEKDGFANGLGAKKAPVNYYEDILVFSKKNSYVEARENPLREIFKKYSDKHGMEHIVDLFFKEGRYKNYETAKVQASYRFGFSKGAKIQMIDRKMFEFLSDHIDFEESYDDISEVYEKHQQKYSSTFNLWENQEVIHPLRDYMHGYVRKHGKQNLTNLVFKSGLYKTMASATTTTHHVFDLEGNNQFKLMSEKLYDFLDDYIRFDRSYEELKQIDNDYKEQVASTFNLWEGKKHKSNIFKYARERPSYHPTMKPTLLLEDLIKTYSNEGDLVVDLTMGSGSTGVACKNTGRKFIGIEMDDEYFKVAKERIEKHEQQLELI